MYIYVTGSTDKSMGEAMYSKVGIFYFGGFWRLKGKKLSIDLISIFIKLLCLK